MFAAFLTAQPDLSPKWVPRFVRIADALPSTATQKIVKRVLRHDYWECDDPVWWRPGRDGAFRRLDHDDIVELRARFAERGRAHLIRG